MPQEITSPQEIEEPTSPDSGSPDTDTDAPTGDGGYGGYGYGGYRVKRPEAPDSPDFYSPENKP